MAASYPSSLPAKDAAGANLSSNPHSTLHDDMYDEIVAIATELGTLPKGTSATVKARLDLFETGAWTSWTPTVTQTGSVTVTNTRSVYARYGRTIHFSMVVTVTGSGTGSSVVQTSLPVTAAGGSARVLSGAGRIYDLSTTTSFQGLPYLVTTTTLRLLPAAVSSSTYLGAADFTAGLAAGDVIEIAGIYEAAS